MNSDFSSKKSMLKKLALTFFRQSIVTGIVFGFLISLSATPIHAWWFTDVRAEPLVTPVHQRGLVLSPLVQNILPEFILEPLSQVEVESPPSTAKTPDTENTATSSVSKIVLSPVDKPNTTQQTTSYPSIVRQMLDAVNRERSK